MDVNKIITDAFNAFAAGDGKKAEVLYLQSAKMGSGHAAHNLGVLYATGVPGVTPDNDKSKYWLNVSLESGFEASVSSNPEWFKSET